MHTQQQQQQQQQQQRNTEREKKLLSGLCVLLLIHVLPYPCSGIFPVLSLPLL